MTTLTFYDGDAAGAERAVTAELDRLEDLLDPALEGSDLWRVNRAEAGEALSLSPAFWAVFDLASEIAALTDEAFSPALYPLTLLWGFGGQTRVPPETEIAAALALRLDFFFLDTDELIRYEHSEIGGDLSAGEFLKRQAALCKRLSDYERTVICCGESLPCFEQNLRALARGAALCGLVCPQDVLYRRRKGTPFYLPHAELSALVQAQKHLPFCDVSLRTKELTSESDFSRPADELLGRLRTVRPDFFG